MAAMLLAASGAVQAAPAVTASFTGPADYTPGRATAYTYTLQISNTGTEGTAPPHPTVQTDFPGAPTSVSWTCAASTGSSCGSGGGAGSGTGNLNRNTGLIAAGGTVTYTFQVQFASSLSDDPLTVTASIGGATPPSVSVDSDLLRVSDVRVAKTSPQSDYSPGGTGSYTVVVTNDGPSDVTGVGLQDTAPAGMTIGNWTCSGAGCPQASGSGNLAISGINLARNASITYTLPVTYAVGASADPIVNTATISVPAAANDPDTSNNSSSHSKPRQPRADLSLAFTPSSPISGGSATYVPGSSGNALTLTVANAGPSSSTASSVQLSFPAEASWTCASCTPTSGTGGSATATVSVPAAGNVPIPMQIAWASSALAATRDIAATVSSGAGDIDPVPGNNSATNRYHINRQVDVRVVKTGPASVNPSTAFTYNVTVSNIGPSDAGNDVANPLERGILLDDSFVAMLQGDPAHCGQESTQPCWAYCPSDGGTVGSYVPSSCPVELVQGSGSISDAAFRLRAGSASTLVVYAAVSGAATGTITNTATVAISDTGVTEVGPSADNTSTVSTEVEFSADIRIVKTDGRTTAVPGQSLTYTIDVFNDGFITVNDVRVDDVLPLFAGAGSPGFVPGSISFQCRAFDGACCNHNSAVCGTTAPTPVQFADVLAAAVDLPGQSRVQFTVQGTLDPRATGTLSNTATATAPAGIDPNPGNNTSTDNNTVLVPQASLSLSKTLDSLAVADPAINPNGPPFTLVYHITAASAGPSFVGGARIEDRLDSTLLDADSASWTCEVISTPAGNTACLSASGSGPLDALVDLDPGGMVRFVLTVDTTAIASGQVVNEAELTSSVGSVSASLTSGLAGNADLSIEVTDLRTEAAPGTDTAYVITVRNSGPDDAFGARVVDAFPPELDGVAWTCEATTPVPGDLAFRAQVGPAASGGDGIVTSADGRHAYVIGADPVTQAGRVWVYSRDNVPGTTFGQMALLETEVHGQNDPQDPGPTVTHMLGPVDLALGADGSMLYVLSTAGDGALAAIVAFTRSTNPADPNFGRLSFAGSVTAGIPATPRRLLVTPQAIYVSGDGVVSIYRRDEVNGLPVFDQQHSANMPAAPGPMAVSWPDALLFVASTSGQALAAFDINTSAGATPIGRLTHRSTLADAHFAGARDLVVRPADRQLYLAAGTAARINLIDFGADTLTKSASYTQSSLVLPGGSANPLAGNVRLALAADGEHLISANRDTDGVVQFRRDTFGGHLQFEALLRDPSLHAGLRNAAGVRITGDGRHLLVASASSATAPLTVYSRRAPDPRFAFIERDRHGDPLPGNGILAGMTAPSDVTVSRDGRHVYVTSLQDNTLSVFSRFAARGLGDDSAGEHLQFLAAYSNGTGGVDGLHRPTQVLVSPDGGSVFVSSEEGNSLAVFSRDNDPESANFGRLTWRQVLRDNIGGNDGLLGAFGLAMDSQSRHLYVAGSFEAAIGIFRLDPGTRLLTYVGVARNGVDGVTGLSGIRDLVVTRDGAQVLGVGSVANTVVVFDRDADPTSPTHGRLGFVQARALAAGDRPVAISMPSSTVASDNEHVYVVAENSNRLYVLRRVLDPGNPASGTLLPLFQYGNNTGGISRMSGPRDVKVSADGRRVYVAAQFGHSVLVFDRDGNRGSSGFGSLSLVEVRSDGVDGVDGLNNVYAISVSADSRNVYAAGFGDNAVASFAVGAGSTCSAGGGGDIDDTVDIGAGGTLVYRATARIRPDATGVLANTATVTPPPRFDDPQPGNNSATDTTALVVRADLSVTKTNDRVSVVAGDEVSYEIVVRNAGPSNIVHGAPPNELTITDIMGAAQGFVPGSVSWTCLAAGSGALDFVQDYGQGIGGLQGVAGLALVADADGGGPLGSYLAAASVVDSTVTLFERDPLDGRLVAVATLAHGGSSGGTPITALAGARSLVASADGRFLYVASRVSDSVSVFELDHHGGQLRVRQIEVQQNLIGLDQALHVVLSPGGQHLYVAGANDAAIAVFARNAGTGRLTWLESERNGINDPTDPGGTVAGLDNVEFLAVSPDGAHLYALSGSNGSIARFARDGATGRLSFQQVIDGNDLGVSMAGASSAVFAPDGDYLYVTAANANRVLVLARNAGTGALTLASHVTQDVAGTQGLLAPRRAVMSGDGRHLYVTAQSGGSVAWFIRDPANGALTFLGMRSNESAGVDGLAGATGIVIDNALDQVYVAGTAQARLTQFERQNDSTCPPSGTGSLVSLPLAIASGGSVTFRINAQVASTHSGVLQNTVSVHSPQDPNQDNNIAVDTDTVVVVADLAISKDDGIAEFDGLAGATALVGDEQHLYVAGAADNAIGVFRRRHDPGQPDYGSLAYAGVVRSGQDGVIGLAAVADLMLGIGGDHVYAASPTDNSVATFRRNRDSGALAFVEIEQNGVLGVTGLSGARALAQSADGRHVYVAGQFSNAIAVFTRDHDSGSAGYGRLSFRSMVQNGVAGVDGIQAPAAVLVSPDGRHVYVLGNGQDTLAVFLRNPNPASAGFGDLSYVTRYIAGPGLLRGLAGGRALLMNDAGTALYVLGATEGTLLRLSRNVDTGALTAAQLVEAPAVLAGASRMRWTPARDAIYVAATAADAVLRFDLDGDGDPLLADMIANGDPAPSGGQVIGLAGVRDVRVSPTSSQLYSVAAGDSALAVFTRDAGSGALAFADVLIDGLGGVAPGEEVTYVITARNHGPSNVTGAIVVDEFPEAFTSVSWTCTASIGASCLGSGSGSLNTPVNLPVGGQVVFLATGTLGESATGRLVNTATISAPGVFDPDESNNSATDDDTVLTPAFDLVVGIDDGGAPAVPGDDVEYAVTVANLGPSYAGRALVSDLLPAAMHDVTWSCDAFPVAGVLSPVQSLAAAGDARTALAVGGLGNFVYASGRRDGAGAVIVYRRDALSGALTELAAYRNGSDGVSGIDGASHLVLSADQRFVYVAGTGSDAVAVFERNAGTGLLTFRAQYQDGENGIDGIGGVRRLLLSPSGAHLYAAGTADNAIAVFGVNAATGLLTPLSIARQGQGGVDGLAGVVDLAWSSDGAHLFAIAGANQSLAAFTRNAGTGALGFAAIVENFSHASNPLLDPSALVVDGDAIYVAAAGSHRISRFRFAAGATPAFSLDLVIANGSDGVSGLQAPRALAFVADQARLYVGGSQGVHLFGLLGERPLQLGHTVPAAVPVVASTTALAASHNGRQLYLASDGASGGIGVFARERGSRCAVAGDGGIGSQTVDIAPGGSLAYTVRGRLFANALGSLSYTVDASGARPEQELTPADNRMTHVRTLVPAPNLSIGKTDGLTSVVAGLPTRYFIDVANAGVSDALAAAVIDRPPRFPDVAAGVRAGVGEFSCSANLPLAFGSASGVGEHAALVGVTALARAVDGSRLYAVNPSQNALLVFPRAVDGSLGVPQVIGNGSALGAATVSGLGGASAVAVSPDGRHVLVTGASSNSIAVFAVDDAGVHHFVQSQTSGSGGVIGLLGPADVVVSADGRRVFVAAATSNAIAVFTRDAASGELAFVERVADGLGTIVPDSNVIRGVRRLSLTRDGSTLHAVAPLSHALTRFDVHPATGKLTYRGARRQTETGMAVLGGARDIVAAPGDHQLYVLGAAGVALFDRAASGAPSLREAYTAIPSLAATRALQLDADGSRLYLADASAVFVFARDWSNGALDLRHRYADASIGAPIDLLHAADSADVYVTDAGGIARLDELALSRCLASSGEGDRIESAVDLGAGGWARYELALQVHPSARGVLVNTATVQPGSGADPDPSDNSGSDSTTVLVQSDLSVAKSGPAQAVAGETIGYRIVVDNAGPSDALGIRVVDTLHAALQSATWTCQASGTSSCPASGSGNLAMLADLHVGDRLTIDLQARIDPAFTGVLPNQASLVPESGATDPTPGDHVAAVSTTVVAVADVSIAKSNGVEQVVAGAPVSYAITVANAGPSNAPQVRVRDLLPPLLQGATWTCTPSTGASCPASGVGNVDFVAALPAGASLALVLGTTLPPDAGGTVENTVTADLLGAVTDPDLANNTATDTDPVVRHADLALQLDDLLDPFDPAGTLPLPYRAVIANAGPSDVTDAVFELQFDAPVVRTSGGIGCSSAGPGAIRCNVGTVRAGSAATLNLHFGTLPAAPAVLAALGSVASATAFDPQPGNNSAVETTELVSGGDVTVGIGNQTHVLVRGREVSYRIDVTNIGSQPVAGITVRVPVAAGLIEATWQCSGSTGVTCGGPGNGDIVDVITLARGQRATYTLQARVDPDLPPGEGNVIAQTVTAEVAPGADINLDNNHAVDADPVRDVIFSDGFEGGDSAPSPAAVHAIDAGNAP